MIPADRSSDVQIGDKITADFRGQQVTGILYGTSHWAEKCGDDLHIAHIELDEPVTSPAGRQISRVYISYPATKTIRKVQR